MNTQETNNKKLVIDRFLSKVNKNSGIFGEDGKYYSECWQWLGSKNKKKFGYEYGRFKIGGKKGRSVLAHRWAYEYFVAPIPHNLELDHLCRNPSCCNPNHLELVNHKTNMSRSREAKKTHCVNGHKFGDNNFYFYGRQRVCKECKKQFSKKYHENNKDRIRKRNREYQRNRRLKQKEITI